MELFYVKGIKPGLVELPPDEGRHAIQVLRHHEGDELQLVDGRGGWFRATIVEASKKRCLVQAVLIRREEHRRPYRLTMAVAPTKSNERYEWFLEKAAEIGVDRIVPLLCARNERRQVRTDRYAKVLVAAMKQSLQAWLPELTGLTPLADMLGPAPGEQRFIGWVDDSVHTLLNHTYRLGTDVTILIGPEGDFTPEEVEQARTAGYVPISLGPNRLRTETAAVAAVHTVESVNWGG